MPRVLIVTYYWPPSGGSGVQRWLKFAKYLPELGWDPIVIAPENAEYPIRDEQLARDVPESVEQIRVPIWEPYALYRRLTGAKVGEVPSTSVGSAGKSPGLLARLSAYLRANFFIPDPRVFWVKPVLARVEELLKTEAIDAIITTGPPHSVHLVGLELKRRHPTLPWIMDVRDPWSQLDVHLAFGPGPRARRRILEMERACLAAADRVLATSPSMPSHLEPFPLERFVSITNGYDAEDFPAVSIAPPAFAKTDAPEPEPAPPAPPAPPAQHEPNAPNEQNAPHPPHPPTFRLLHTGLLSSNRNPAALWQALADHCVRDAGFAERLDLQLIGKVDSAVLASLGSHSALAGRYTVTPWLDHRDLIAHYATADVLLLCPNLSDNARGQINGKLFEYLAARRPILHIGPFDADNTRILDAAHAGLTIPPGDLTAAAEAVRLLDGGGFGESPHAFRDDVIKSYDRRETARQLAQLLDELTLQPLPTGVGPRH